MFQKRPVLFKFLTYLQPTSYFSLKKKDGHSIFPVVADLPETIRKQLQLDENYQSDIAKQYDLSWQAIQKGYIGTAETISGVENLPIIDNYRFIRKYFNFAWVLYVLFLRLISLKNPIREISGFFNSRSATPSLYLKEGIQYLQWEHFDSELVTSQPKVSVIIPTLNRYDYLKDVLQDLELQDYRNFEVIVIDQSEPFNKQFYKDFNLDLKLHYQKEKALWLARNTAIRRSESDYILLFDDDSRFDKDWISNHLKCMDYFDADISSGVSISKVGAKVPEHYSFFRISDQLDTGNVLIKKQLFRTIGLFDRQFEKQRMGDGEYGLRAYLHGYLNISNPYAQRLHLKVDSGGLRQMGSWDAFRTSSIFAPRPIPSVLYFFRTYFGNKRTFLAIIRTVPLSIMPYRFKKNKPLLIFGVFVSLLLLPLVCSQVLKSWRLASKKLIEGPLIEYLN